jgi:hypothetical protein
MSSFTSPLIVEVQQKERKCRGLATLVQPFSYYDEINVITVPAGYETDFTSVPLLARWFVSNFDRTAKAAVLHDWMLDSGYDRKYADNTFRKALMILDVPKWKANILWVAVRMRSLVTRKNARAGNPPL